MKIYFSKKKKKTKTEKKYLDLTICKSETNLFLRESHLEKIIWIQFLGKRDFLVQFVSRCALFFKEALKDFDHLKINKKVYEVIFFTCESIYIFRMFIQYIIQQVKIQTLQNLFFFKYSFSAIHTSSMFSSRFAILILIEVQGSSL